jgi:arylsulfatase
VYDLEYRRKIDNEMTTHAIEWVRAQADADEPFFLFMGMTRPHFPNLPSDEFKGRSRIGGYGDCVMELDWNVGRLMEALEEAGIEQDTIFIFLSDNGPTTTATLPEEMHLASAGPWRGELGDPWEGSIRTVGMIRWPEQIEPGTANGMVSIMDFLPTLNSVLGGDLPVDRPIDGIDQSDYFTGKTAKSGRESLLTFIADRLAAVRWNQWRIYTQHFGFSHDNPSLGGYLGYRSETAGYPIIYNIEADPREMRAVQAENTWVMHPYAEAIGAYKASLAEHPNPPVPTFTQF